MDEGTAELLSRYLDGDLDAAESRLIEARLAAEPELRAELAALRRLQLQVRSVADRMMPPAALDAPPRPADRGAPSTPGRVPPAVRWLGLAAGVALAVTVAVEVARRPPQARVPTTVTTPSEAPAATPPSAAAAAHAPAPEAAPLRADEAGETDAALPPAEPAPPSPAGARRRLQPPEQQELSIAAEQQSKVATGRTPAAASGTLADAEGALKDRAGTLSPSDNVAAVAAAPKRERAEAVASDEAAAFNALAEPGAAPPGAGVLRLELAGDDGVVLGALALPAASADIGSRFVVTVAAGVIVAIEPDAAGSALDELIGQHLAGLPDGRYLGVVVVHAAVD
jgi:hypothetical protein